jgi:hypothetical protein
MAGPASRVSSVLMTGPLAPFADAYSAELRKRGYTPLSTVNELRQVGRLSRWLEASGLGVADLSAVTYVLAAQPGQVAGAAKRQARARSPSSKTACPTAFRSPKERPRPGQRTVGPSPDSNAPRSIFMPRRAGAQVETAATTTGAVAGARARGLARQPGWTKARALVRGREAVDARTGKLAPFLLRLVVHVTGCRRDPAIMRRGSDASSTRNDTPSAAAVERVLWARRHGEARPPGAPVAVSIVSGATHHLSMSSWS